MKHLIGLVKLISLDNNMPMKPLEDIVFPEGYGYDWNKLNSQASELHVYEAELLCCGEVGEVNNLVVDKGLQDLDRALNQIFDGCLNKYFFTD